MTTLRFSLSKFSLSKFLLGLIALCLLPCLFAGRAGAQAVYIPTDISKSTYSRGNGYIQQPVVATRGAIFGTIASGNLSGTYRTGVIFPRACCDIRLVYTNVCVDGGGEHSGANDITIRASAEYLLLPHQVTFGGQDTVTIKPGGTVVSDPVSEDIPAGSTLYMRTYISIASGSWPVGNAGSSTYQDGFIAGSDQSRVVVGSPLSIIPATTTQMYTPLCVIGTTLPRNQATLLGVGDSIIGGYSSIDNSYLARLGLPFIDEGVGGESGSTWTNDQRGHAYSMMLAPACSNAIVAYGTNDINGGTSIASAEAMLTTIYNGCLLRGMSVYGATLPPKSSSTDGFATTGNQSFVTTPTGVWTPGGIRGQLNAWIRANWQSLGLSGYIEVADTVETSRDSCVWKAGYAVDGVHPSPTGYAAIAAAINVSQFKP